VQQLVLSSPFDLPELVASEGAVPMFAARPDDGLSRMVNPGEEEIVIPMPLWAQMGRGTRSQVEEILSSPRMPRGFQPPLGTYRLVLPAPVDLTGGAPATTPGLVELSGPTRLTLDIQQGGPVAARNDGGSFMLGRVPIDDGETLFTARGRMRVGAPLDAAALAMVAARREQSSSSGASSQVAWSGSGSPAPGDASDFGAGSLSAPSSASSLPVPRVPDVALPSMPGASQLIGQGRPMAGALQSALRMSSAVDGRTLPATGASTLQPFNPGASGSAGSLSGSGSPAGGSDQVLVARSGARVSAAAGDAPGTSSVVSGAAASSSQATGIRFDDSATGSAVSGLPAGAWSGDTRTTGGYTPWNYTPDASRSPVVTVGGVPLSQGLSRPDAMPSLPTALRFRYAGAPLWWSQTGRFGGATDSGGELDDSGQSRFGRPLAAALRAATSAATLWRSILVHPSRSDGGGPSGGGDSGGMDRSWDQNAQAMTSADSKLAILAFGAGAPAATLPGRGAESVYIAMDSAGRAGAVAGSHPAGASRPSALQMSIVAAIPPSPPSLESMSASSTANSTHVEPRARKSGAAGHGEQKGAEESGNSQSKIEGSVDAIAQRIYHRIRRRIASDRERFGG
jgi:hypothetical protein